MKIATICKKSLEGHIAKINSLETLRAQADFDVCECDCLADIPADSDLLLVFGGDGTMLDAAVKASELDIPVLGMNLGNLGFLAELEPDATAQQLLSAVNCRKYISRNLLSAEFNGNRFTSLNDIVLKAHSRPINIDLHVNGGFVDSYHADGIIIASPTGSTAYSLSAGGPIIAPDVDAVVINPICPHSLHSRSLVVGGSAEISVTVDGKYDTDVVIDGKVVFVADTEMTVTIKKSNKKVKFVALNKNGFYDKLLEKMNRWGTTHTIGG